MREKKTRHAACRPLKNTDAYTEYLKTLKYSFWRWSCNFRLNDWGNFTVLNHLTKNVVYSRAEWFAWINGMYLMSTALWVRKLCPRKGSLEEREDGPLLPSAARTAVPWPLTTRLVRGRARPARPPEGSVSRGSSQKLAGGPCSDPQWAVFVSSGC